METFILIFSVVFTVWKLYQFFDDYKKEKFLFASFELFFAIVLIVPAICVMWNLTLQMIL